MILFSISDSCDALDMNMRWVEYLGMLMSLLSSRNGPMYFSKLSNSVNLSLMKYAFNHTVINTPMIVASSSETQPPCVNFSRLAARKEAFYGQVNDQENRQ
jgi:hypothetical protein